MNAWLYAACLATAISSAEAAEVAGVSFGRTLPAPEAQLVLQGVALKEATFLGVDVYVVALYASESWVPTETPAASLVADSLGCAFVVHFLRDIDRKKLARSWVDDLANACNGPCEDLLREARTLADGLRDVRRGDRILYRATREGVDVRLGGKSLGRLHGPRAARAVAAAFLGPRAPKELRETLLAAHRGRPKTAP